MFFYLVTFGASCIWLAVASSPTSAIVSGLWPIGNAWGLSTKIKQAIRKGNTDNK